ncbi:mercuric reductase [candidate division KSB1 bacterium]|nr:MAG: mercuric reductase [candidate division KSB1 bacterium]
MAENPNIQNEPSGHNRYNLVIIGGGPAGLATAIGAAALGARVAMVERGLLGGDSLHVGSVPSKSLVRAARAAAEVRRAGDFGITVPSGAEVDIAAVMQRLDRLRSRIAGRNSVARLAEKGIEVFVGEGRFADHSHVEVGGQRLHFSRAVIATGSKPAVPALPGLDRVPFMTTDHLFTLTHLPRRLAVIGAGPAGCEMAQVFARFGSIVTVFEQANQILPHEDADAARMVQRALHHDGISFRLDCSELRFEKEGADVIVHSHAGEHWYADPCDRVLLAAGRVPRTEGLNLEAASVGTDERGILVNGQLRTSNPHIYAAGDVCSQYRYTHAADALARVVIANALFFAGDSAGDLLVPNCTFTDPEIAHVGLSETEAKERHLQTMKLPFDDLDRAILDSGEAGLLKIHHDVRGTIKGATLVAAHAGEMIGEIVVAMNHSVRLGSLSSDIHPYPTVAEIIKRAGDQFRHTLVTPFMARLLKKFLAWRR